MANKEVNAALRRSVHRPPASPRAERQPTPSEKFSATLRTEGLRSVRIVTARKETIDEPTT